MPEMILAASVSDNAPGGAILTFAFPVILFSVIAVILYLLFSRPHRRIPSQRVVFAGPASAVPEAAGTQRERAGAEERGEAAPGGGRHAAQPGNGWPGGTGNVSGEGRGPGGTGGDEQGTHGTEGSE